MRSQARLRNFGTMAHVDAGRTTVSERILYLTGRIHRMGEVHHGAATLDHTAIERDRGITISSAAVTASWDDHRLNLIDTPGHVDFGAEVERSLRVLDGAVAVFDAVAGVEPQSETVWHQADPLRVARVVFVNKLDRVGADLGRCVAEIASVLGATPLPVQVPVLDDGRLVGVVDLVGGRRLRWSGVDPRSLSVAPVVPGVDPVLDRARSELVESVAGLDEELLERFPTGVGRRPLRRAAAGHAGRGRRAGPGRLGAGRDRCPAVARRRGGLVAVPPRPGCRRRRRPGRSPADPDTVLTRTPDPGGPLAALAFKVAHPAAGRKLTWLRVYSGSLARGDRVLDPTSGSVERVGRLVQLDAGSTVEVERLSAALGRLGDEDPTFTVRADPETGQTLIAGMGELHLQLLIERLAYVDATSGGVVPAAYARAVADGARDALSRGPLAGFPLVGVRVVLVDGAVHSNDSSERAFRLAGARAVAEAAALAGPVRLEPVMSVAVTTPDEHLGAVLGVLGGPPGRGHRGVGAGRAGGGQGGGAPGRAVRPG